MRVVYIRLLVIFLTMGAGAVYNALAASWEPSPHTELPCPDIIQLNMQLNMPGFVDSHERPAPF